VRYKTKYRSSRRLVKELGKFFVGTAAYLNQAPIPDTESDVERMDWIPIKDVPALLLLRKTLLDNPWWAEHPEDPVALSLRHVAHRLETWHEERFGHDSEGRSGPALVLLDRIALIDVVNLWSVR